MVVLADDTDSSMKHKTAKTAPLICVSRTSMSSMALDANEERIKRQSPDKIIYSLALTESV